VRWEHNSSTVGDEGVCSDSDEDSKGPERVVIYSDFSHLRIDKSVQICLTVWCKQYVLVLDFFHYDILDYHTGSGRIGCAYYNSITCVIHAMEDTEESLHFDLTMMR
jgi:DNA mismatch repair protein MSH5